MKNYLKVIKNYAVFSGRAGPAEFWQFFFISFAITLLLAVLDFFVIVPLAILYQLAVFVPSLAVGARRLHDTGRSGWLQMLLIIPIVGFIILVVFWCQGSTEDNQFGTTP